VVGNRRFGVVRHQLGASSRFRQQAGLGILIVIGDYQRARQHHYAGQCHKAGQQQLHGQGEIADETVHECTRDPVALDERLWRRYVAVSVALAAAPARPPHAAKAPATPCVGASRKGFRGLNFQWRINDFPRGRGTALTIC
jgi:hypothetical protein